MKPAPYGPFCGFGARPRMDEIFRGEDADVGCYPRPPSFLALFSECNGDKSLGYYNSIP